MSRSFSLGDLEAVRGFIGTIDAMPPGVVTPFLIALAERSRGRLGVLDGEPDAVEPNFKAAIGLFRVTGIPYARALSQLELAEWLVAEHRQGDATPLIREARDTLERLGASGWLERLGRVEVEVEAAAAG